MAAALRLGARSAATARVSGEKVRKLEGVLHEAAGCLSPAHVAALVAHPDAVRSALAVAADVLAMDDAGRTEIDTITGAEPHLVDDGVDRVMAERGQEVLAHDPSVRLPRGGLPPTLWLLSAKGLG